MVQKIFSKIHLVSCTNTDRDVTDLVNHGMVKNTKTLISWEQNIIFLRNKNILNLCFRWHIFRSYRFVAEVTFNFLNSVTKSWKFWPSSCVYVKNSWRRMVMFFLGLHYSKNLCRTEANFISSPGSKVKVPYISLPFWPILSHLVSFSVAAK